MATGMLTQRHMVALTLRRDQGLTFREIGNRLGVTQERARQLWGRADFLVRWRGLIPTADSLVAHLDRMSAARLGG